MKDLCSESYEGGHLGGHLEGHFGTLKHRCVEPSERSIHPITKLHHRFSSNLNFRVIQD